MIQNEIINERVRPLNMIRAGFVIAGGILVHLCLGSFYIFGNISPYMISYLRNRTSEHNLRNVDNLWIMNAASVLIPFGVTIGGVVDRYLGVRLATGLGCLFFCLGVSLTYFTVKTSLWSVSLTYGSLTSLGSSLAYGPPAQVAIKWIPTRPTLAVGLIVCGFGGGALVFNQVVTVYLNPENLSPDLETDDGQKYFTDKDLLDRVPKLFLILGAFYAGCQLIGICALGEPPVNQKVHVLDHEDIVETEKQNRSKVKLSVKAALWQLMKSRHAWILLAFVFLIDGANQFAISLYKAYGQSFISDDHFLALIGSISSVFNCIFRPVWGALMDKCGFQVTAKLIAATFVCLSCTIVFTESLGKVAFMLWICGLYGSFCGIWSVAPATLAKLFGVENMAITMGAMFLSVSAATIAGGLIGISLVDVFGWHGLFLLSGFMGAAAFFLTFFFDGKDTEGQTI